MVEVQSAPAVNAIRGVAIWPNPMVVGWDGTEHGKMTPGVGLYKVVSFEEAFKTHWPYDAHCVGYRIPGESAQPRLRKTAMRTLIDQGVEPVLETIFLDVDNDGHKPWKNLREAAETLENLLEAYGGKRGPLENAGIYSTRAGFRLVFLPEKPIAVSHCRDWLDSFISHIEQTTGITIDAVSNQWDRCYRLPFVVRDGSPTKSLSKMDAILAGDTTSFTPRLAPKRRVSGRAQGVSTLASNAPETPEAPSDFQWAALESAPMAGKFLTRLKSGKPIAKEGKRDVTMIKLLASIASHLEETRPEALYAFLHDSILSDDSDGAPTLEKLWDRSCYFAQKEIDAAKAKEDLKDTPPILYKAGAYWVLDLENSSKGTYRPGVHAPALCQALESGCGTLGLQTRTATGKPRSVSDYLADFGRQVTEVIAEMGREESIFLPDLNGGTLIESCCVLRKDVKPARHNDINKWLRYVGGDQQEQFLDWLATITEIDKPTCALYIEGVNGIGKGMLAAGVASLWGTGATAYESAVGAFNSALTRCPIVFADETMTPLGKSENFSAAFRSLIAESERPLRRKYMPDATIRGCVRLIIAANNADALALRENLTMEDLDAIAARILHIASMPEAKEFLISIGGRATTEEWVSRGNGKPGKMAEHLLWLKAKRKVKRGSRFIVEGHFQTFHRDLVLSAGINMQVLTALAHFVDRSNLHPGILLHDDRGVLVNSFELKKLWPKLYGDRPPGEGDIARCLRGLSIANVRARAQGSYRRYYAIPRESVLRVAEILQIGDADDMAAKIEGKKNERVREVLDFPAAGEK